MSHKFEENPHWRKNLSNYEVPFSVRNDDLLSITLSKIIKGERISKDLGAEIHRESSLPGISALADSIKRSRFGDMIFFNENLHVNTTNICNLACRFCAFRRGSRHDDSYALSANDFASRIQPYRGIIDEVHAVGGLHPEWTIDPYKDVYRITKKRFPEISIKSLTAIEVKHIASRSGLSIFETLESLKNSGLDSLPGGGAEILVDRVRDRICRGKESSKEYLSIHETAHSLGIPTNCTIRFRKNEGR